MLLFHFFCNIDHREHGNRIIHENLTGSPVFRGSILDPDIAE